MTPSYGRESATRCVVCVRMRDVRVSSRWAERLERLVNAATEDVAAVLEAATRSRRLCGLSCIDSDSRLSIEAVELLFEDDLPEVLDAVAAGTPYWQWWPTRIELDSRHDGEAEAVYDALRASLIGEDLTPGRWFAARVARRCAAQLTDAEVRRPLLAWAGGWVEQDIPRTVGYATPAADLAALQAAGLVPVAIRPEPPMLGDGSGLPTAAPAGSARLPEAVEALVRQELDAVKVALTMLPPAHDAHVVGLMADNADHAEVAYVFVGTAEDLARFPVDADGRRRLDGSYWYWDDMTLGRPVDGSRDPAVETAGREALEAAEGSDPALEVAWQVAHRLRPQDVNGTTSADLVFYATAEDPMEDPDLERRVEEVNGRAAFERLVEEGAFQLP